jgi:hypothetical protein
MEMAYRVVPGMEKIHNISANWGTSQIGKKVWYEKISVNKGPSCPLKLSIANNVVTAVSISAMRFKQVLVMKI